MPTRCLFLQSHDHFQPIINQQEVSWRKLKEPLTDLFCTNRQKSLVFIRKFRTIYIERCQGKYIEYFCILFEHQQQQ